MNNRNRGFTKSLAMGVIVLIIMAYGIYYAMQSPIGSPDENNRIRHPAGFSIVIPTGWESRITHADPDKKLDDTILSMPIKSSGRPGSFNVIKLYEAPDLSKLLSEGYEKSERLPFPSYRKLWDGNYVRHLVYYFEKEGTWYSIDLNRNLSEPVDSWWQRFIVTFRVEAPAPVAQH